MVTPLCRHARKPIIYDRHQNCEYASIVSNNLLFDLAQMMAILYFAPVLTVLGLWFWVMRTKVLYGYNYFSKKIMNLLRTILMKMIFYSLTLDKWWPFKKIPNSAMSICGTF